MKKIIAVLVFVLVAAGIAFAQADGMLNLNRYAEYFGFQGGRVNPNNDYVIGASRTDRRNFSVLDGSETVLDTPLEFALLSYYSQPVLNIRPAEANAILPANNPRLADQKLGAAVFQEMQILRFLGDTAAVGRHEAVLSFITGRGNATRQEIETYYRNGIRGLIAGIVDEEFNEIRFRLDWYNATLTRTSENQYILSYKDVNDAVKELPPTSLEVLLATVRNNRTEFSSNDVNTVRAQAALIPVVAYPRSEIQTIVDELTRFYLSPDRSNFDVLVRKYRTLRADLSNGRRGNAASLSYYRVVNELNAGLSSMLFN
jgi:hypothetical protein